jgi:hypothetical protein
MNLYVIVFRAGVGEESGGLTPPWTLSPSVFETQEDALAWAEREMAGNTWRLVMLSSIAVLQ